MKIDLYRVFALITLSSSIFQTTAQSVHSEDSSVTVNASKGYQIPELTEGALIKRSLSKSAYNNPITLSDFVNEIAGFSWEERGYGGSRRFSISGSSLRSPFAVRNIKIYQNGVKAVN